MFLSSILLAISSSIDSLGIGITYGLRKTGLPIQAKAILFVISLLITSISILCGGLLLHILPASIASLLGCLLLVLMGIWMIIQALGKKKDSSKEDQEVLGISQETKKVYQLFLKSFGLTIQIIRDPISSDQDCSNRIDAKEAIYLGIALSIDSLGIGIGGGILGVNFFVFPVLVAIFQIVSLSIGRLLGSKIAHISHVPESIWNVVSGVLLIFIGIARMFL